MDSELPKPKKPHLQIRTLAFNLNGWALEGGMAESRNMNQLVCASEPSSTTFAEFTQRKNLLSSAFPLFKEESSLSARELGPPGLGINQYLAVGYTPRARNKAQFGHNKGGKSRRKSQGNENPGNATP